MLDMGPYYLTALVNLMGPAKSVTGSARVTFPERTITSEPLNGTKIEVETPTHISGIVNFENGAIATVLTTFDIWGAKLPFIEIYGSEGSLSVPNPNNFGAPVQILKRSTGEWEDVPVTRPFADNSRGLGVADMAMAADVGVTVQEGDTGWFFGEDQARYLLATNNADALITAAKAAGVVAAEIGAFGGTDIALGESKVSLTDVKDAFEGGFPKIAT